MLSAVICLEPGLDFLLGGLALDGLEGLFDALVPIEAGSWAISAWTTPSLSCLTCAGPASKPTILTWSCLPDWRTPVAVPSAANVLAAKTPTMSGSLANAAETSLAASAGSLWLYCTPRYSKEESALAPSSNPATRASAVETPGSVEMTRTLPPLGLRFLIALKASSAAALIV